MKTKQKIVHFITAALSISLFVLPVTAQAETKELTDNDYKIIWSPKNLSACVWATDRHMKKRQYGVSKEMWKRMMETCYQGIDESKKMAKEKGYDPVAQQKAAILRYDEKSVAYYKTLFPDWQKNETALIEKIQKECGVACDSETPMSDEEVQAAKTKGNKELMEKLGF
jgi:hypothetical protein